jgi:hypothetical protein
MDSSRVVSVRGESREARDRTMNGIATQSLKGERIIFDVHAFPEDWSRHSSNFHAAQVTAKK